MPARASSCARARAGRGRPRDLRRTARRAPVGPPRARDRRVGRASRPSQALLGREQASRDRSRSARARLQPRRGSAAARRGGRAARARFRPGSTSARAAPPAACGHQPGREGGDLRRIRVARPGVDEERELQQPLARLRRSPRGRVRGRRPSRTSARPACGRRAVESALRAGAAAQRTPSAETQPAPLCARGPAASRRFISNGGGPAGSRTTEAATRAAVDARRRAVHANVRPERVHADEARPLRGLPQPLAEHALVEPRHPGEAHRRAVEQRVEAVVDDLALGPDRVRGMGQRDLELHHAVERRSSGSKGRSMYRPIGLRSEVKQRCGSSPTICST